jgi:TolB-like protein/DNA-binding SARP family transcriptional activator/Flp pilus assembly protein TadD
MLMNTTSASGNGSEARWSVRLLSGFEVSVLPGGGRVTSLGKRERVLLAYLALSPKGREQRRKLTTLLWGDAADETTLENLRNCLYSLRKALGDSEHRVIASDGEDIVLDAAAFDVDALAFRRLAAQSGRNDLEEAAKLCSGGLLDGLDIESEEFESWRRAEAARFRDQAAEVLNRLMTQLSEAGETERAIETGERILRLDPLHEAAVRRLMRLYADSGRRGAAVQLYRTLATALRTEFDAQPEAETRLALAQIAQGGEERTSKPAAADDELRPRSTTMARPGDVAGQTLRPPRWPSFRLHAPLTILAGVLLGAIALISYRQFAPLAITADQAVVAERAAAADPASAISIAVLPFLNLSGDASQEFFSDGMTEEITAALAMVSDLKVVARTSAFQFKGEKNDMRAVGQALNATHLIEGSVRKDGNRVRITAQLIEVGKGTHLWTENYDRQLSDIFATQEEIARTIVGSLMTPLGLAPGERLVSNRAIDPESYQQFLRARALYRARSPGAIEGMIRILEPVVTRDPDYAPAWALLAQGYSAFPDKAEKAAREAIRLDARNAIGYAVLAGIQIRLGNFAAAENLNQQALALDPDDPDVLNTISNRLAFFGHVKEAVSMREKLRTLEPFVPVYNYITASIMLNNGQNQAAIAILEAAPAGDAGGTVGPRRVTLARAYAAEGRYGEAADTLLTIPQQGQQSRRSIEEAALLLRNAPTKVSLPGALPAWDGELGFVYAYVGAPDRVLDHPERVGVHRLDPPAARYLWSSEVAPARRTERFKALVRTAGYVDYWRASGWPDHCRPVGANDFACE